MILSRRARELSLSVLLFALPVVLLYGNIEHPSHLNVVDRQVVRASGILQRLVRGVLLGTSGLWESYVALWDLDARNAVLRRRYFELRENSEILGYWARRARRLERDLGFSTAPPLHTHAADVVAQGVSPFFQTLRIRVRRGDPPRANQPVAVPEGLVGRVQRVSGDYADVFLLTDVQSRIKVSVKHSGSRGELRGAGRRSRLRGRIEYLSSRDRVEPGDLLITSGMDGVYPRDLPVARVSSVGSRIKGQYQEVEADILLDTAELSTVYLVASTRIEHSRPAARSRSGP